jgi:cytosine/adenosine deaminase-related metal-dependent hydrolase
VVWTRPVSLVNARVVAADGLASSLRFGSRVLAIDARPRRGDVVIDLDGAFVLPGLINAHDHLELNHYGPLKCRDRYDNASAWIDDMRPRLRTDASIRVNQAHPLASRLFIGGLKNLLAGVTTVAHHNPRYREIRGNVPVRVLARYGWAHSLQLECQPVGAHGEPGGDVRACHRATSPGAPFIVHAGEGVDEAARSEIDRLDALGCLKGNTILVHGVAVSPEQWARVVRCGAGLVWCPASNDFLFGRTAPVRAFLDSSAAAHTHVCLGSDSRVTGARDLLDELRAAISLTAVTASELLRMVTTAPARLLRLPDAGRLTEGTPADMVILPAKKAGVAEALIETSRADIALVTIAGRPMIGAPVLKPVFQARRTSTRPIVVDGVDRVADARLARAIARCPIREPGVECVSSR